jgi:hypothetical protein
MGPGHQVDVQREGADDQDQDRKEASHEAG